MATRSHSDTIEMQYNAISFSYTCTLTEVVSRAQYALITFSINDNLMDGIINVGVPKYLVC
jgi:hypothetical protein